MKDWVTLLTAIIQLITAFKIFQSSGKKTNKKGTPRKRPRKR